MSLLNLNSSELSDTDLVKLSVENPDNYLLLMKRYEYKLLYYINRISGSSKENCEDILQNVFIKVYKNLNNFNQKYKFSSWIYRIAHNETINWLKKHKLQAYSSSLSEETDLIDNLASDFNLENDFNKKELGKEITQILGQMSTKYREVLILKFLEEKSYEEISDILQKPIGTVGTLINRAKKQFREKAKELGLNTK